MIVFNLEKYVDFDMPASQGIMIAPAGMTKKIATEIAKEAKELFKNTNEVDGLIKYLKSWGCTTAKTYNITVGGSL